MWNKPKATESRLWHSAPHSLTQVLRLLWMIMSKVVPKSQVHYIKLVIPSATFDEYSELSNRQWNIITFPQACWLCPFKITSVYLCINLNFILLYICCIGMEVRLTALLFFETLYKKCITFLQYKTMLKWNVLILTYFPLFLKFQSSRAITVYLIEFFQRLFH